ncbi:TPA: hypothetical protein ACRZ4F_001579 [Vibrio harveyi]
MCKQLKVGALVPPWTLTECDQCSHSFYITRCDAKLLEEKDLTCCDCREANRVADIEAQNAKLVELIAAIDGSAVPFHKMDDDELSKTVRFYQVEPAPIQEAVKYLNEITKPVIKVTDGEQFSGIKLAIKGEGDD